MQTGKFNAKMMLSALWKYAPHIIILITVTTAVAYYFVSRQPILYDATVTVMVETQRPKLDLPAGLAITYMPDVSSQVQIIRSNTVIDNAIVKLQPDKANDSYYLNMEASRIQRALRISQVQNSNVVAITITERDPELAANEANAIADSFVSEAQKATVSAVESSLEKTNQQMKQMASSEIDVSVNPSIAMLVSSLTSSSDTLATALAQFRVDSSFNGTQVGDSAVPNIKWQILSSLIAQTKAVADNVTKSLTSVGEAEAGLALGSPAPDIQKQKAYVSNMESTTRIISTEIDDLNAQIVLLNKSGADPAIDGEIGIVQQRMATVVQYWSDIVSQVVSLYGVIGNNNNTQGIADGINRIDLLWGVVANVLNDMPAQLADLEALVTKDTQARIKLAEDLTSSSKTTIDGTLNKIRAASRSDPSVLTYDDLSGIENDANVAAKQLGSAQAILSNVSQDRVSDQVYHSIGIIQDYLVAVKTKIGQIPDDIAQVIDNGQSAMSFAALNTLRQELQLSLVSNQGNDIRVVDRASIASSASGILGRYWNVLVAVVVTTLLSLLGVALIQYFDTSVNSPGQAEAYVGLPVVASISKVARKKSRQPSVLDPDNKHLLESFRILRTNLGLDYHKGKMLLITSPGEREGKTTVAANLARVVALQGHKVLLVDADTVSARPGMTRAFNLWKSSEITLSSFEIEPAEAYKENKFSRIVDKAPAANLTELVTRSDGMWEYANNEDSVDIISLDRASNPTEITSSVRMNEFIANTKKLYDVVIFDGPPVIGHADTRILAAQMDEVLLVLRKDVSRLDLAKDSKEALETVGSNIPGFVLVG